MRSSIFVTIALFFPAVLSAEETFVTIQKVSGNQLAVVKDTGGGRGPRGRGAVGQAVAITVPVDAKITSAMRERRTFEFRVGAELAGGLRHHIFTEMEQPLSARIVTDGDRIVEINVITPESDINQSNTDAGGQTVIAVRPKRPPQKKK